MYLTFAVYDIEYIEYVTGRSAIREENKDTFLDMHEYGPFRMDNADDVKALGLYVLTYVLQEE